MKTPHEKSAKQHIVEKSNKGIFDSKKTLLVLIFVATALLVFAAGIYGIIKVPADSQSIVNLAQVVITLISGTMTAALLGINVLDYKTVSSLENISKSETVKNVTETIEEKVEKVLRPKDVDNGSIQ